MKTKQAAHWNSVPEKIADSVCCFHLKSARYFFDDWLQTNSKKNRSNNIWGYVCRVAISHQLLCE